MSGPQETGVARTVSQACLCLADSDRIAVAFCRGDLYGLRVAVMEQWARHVAPGSWDLTAASAMRRRTAAHLGIKR